MPVCSREGCAVEYTPAPQNAAKQRFCSTRCRQKAWHHAGGFYTRRKYDLRVRIARKQRQLEELGT